MRQMFCEKQTLGKAQNYLSLESNPIFFLRHTCQSMNEVSLEDIENVNTQTCVGKVIRLVCPAGVCKSCLVTVSTSFREESSPVSCPNCWTLFLIASLHPQQTQRKAAVGGLSNVILNIYPSCFENSFALFR